MPGLSGIFTKSKGQDRSSQLWLMLKALSNKQPVCYRTYENHELGIWLGWSNLESEPGETLAAWNEGKDALLIFSGEDIDLGNRTGRSKGENGKVFGQDASHIVRILGEEGIRFLADISGRFSGAYWNERIRVLHIFVDRSGLEKLYCHEDEQAVYFSSEAKSLLRILPSARQLNANGLAQFFALGFVGDNKTLFEGIDLLPAGTVWTYASDGRSEKATYIETVTSGCDEVMNEDDLEAQLVATLTGVMDRTAMIHGKTAVLLNGGIEARVLMAWATFPPLKVLCLVPVVGSEDHRSVRAAQRVSEICQQHSRILEVNRSFVSEFPALAKRTVVYSDGVVDVSGSVELFIYRQAAEIASTCIRADFGNQVLGNGVSEIPVAANGNFLNRDFAVIFEAERNRLYQDLQDSDPMSSFYRQLPWRYYPRIALVHGYMGLRLPFLHNELIQLGHRLPRARAQGKGRLLHLVAAGDSRLAKVAVSEAFQDKGRKSFVRASLPFKRMDKICPRMRDYDSNRARIYRRPIPSRSAVGTMPHRLVSSQFRIWYRTCLAKYVKDILLDRKSLQRPYLNGALIEGMLNRYQKGQDDCTSEIHRLLTIELVQRQLIDAPLRDASC